MNHNPANKYPWVHIGGKLLSKWWEESADLGCQDSLGHKSACCRIWQREFEPRTHLLKGKHELTKVVLWSAQTHHSMHHRPQYPIKKCKIRGMVTFSYGIILLISIEMRVIKNPCQSNSDSCRSMHVKIDWWIYI